MVGTANFFFQRLLRATVERPYIGQEQGALGKPWGTTGHFFDNSRRGQRAHGFAWLWFLFLNRGALETVEISDLAPYLFFTTTRDLKSVPWCDIGRVRRIVK